MTTAFSRTMRSLAVDDGRASLAGSVAIVALLGLWALWATTARVAVFERSDTARIEVRSAVFPVESTEGGRVASNRMRLGARVNAEDILVELDVRNEVLQRAEGQSRLDALDPQLAAFRAQLQATSRSLAGSVGENAAAVRVAGARLRESRALAANGRVEAERAEQLLRAGHGSAVDAQRARAQAEAQASAAAALELEVQRLPLDGQVRTNTQRAEVARLQGEIARLAGEQSTLRASLATLINVAARRVIRAPVAGRLGSIVELRPGSVVAAGQRLATVVPEGELRVVGEFAPPAALGRIRSGQPARVRLDGFPWVQWGTVAAHVRFVASEAREGYVRVELSIDIPRSTRIPIEHGLPGSIEVEVERVAPATLILRAAGRAVSGASLPAAHP